MFVRTSRYRQQVVLAALVPRRRACAATRRRLWKRFRYRAFARRSTIGENIAYHPASAAGVDAFMGSGGLARFIRPKEGTHQGKSPLI